MRGCYLTSYAINRSFEPPTRVCNLRLCRRGLVGIGVAAGLVLTRVT